MAKAKARTPWNAGSKAAKVAKDEEAEAKARMEKLSRAFDDKTMDPKLETELRDLRSRFEKKTSKAKEGEDIDTSMAAENKALAMQQRNNNTIKWAEQKNGSTEIGHEGSRRGAGEAKREDNTSRKGGKGSQRRNLHTGKD